MITQYGVYVSMARDLPGAVSLKLGNRSVVAQQLKSLV